MMIIPHHARRLLVRDRASSYPLLVHLQEGRLLAWLSLLYIVPSLGNLVLLYVLAFARVEGGAGAARWPGSRPYPPPSLPPPLPPQRIELRITARPGRAMR